MMAPPPTRRRFVKCALELVGTPYIYGGRSPQGLDCWGFISLAYRMAGGRSYDSWWTDIAWQTLPRIEVAAVLPGDPAFFGGHGPDDVEHVMLALWDEMLIGASGGTSKCRTLADAHRLNAKTKVVEDVTAYDKARGHDFRGYCRLPFEGE